MRFFLFFPIAFLFFASSVFAQITEDISARDLLEIVKKAELDAQRLGKQVRQANISYESITSQVDRIAEIASERGVPQTGSERRFPSEAGRSSEVAQFDAQMKLVQDYVYQRDLLVRLRILFLVKYKKFLVDRIIDEVVAKKGKLPRTIATKYSTFLTQYEPVVSRLTSEANYNANSRKGRLQMPGDPAAALFKSYGSLVLALEGQFSWTAAWKARFAEIKKMLRVVKPLVIGALKNMGTFAKFVSDLVGAKRHRSIWPDLHRIFKEVVKAENATLEVKANNLPEYIKEGPNKGKIAVYDRSGKRQIVDAVVFMPSHLGPEFTTLGHTEIMERMGRTGGYDAHSKSTAVTSIFSYVKDISVVPESARQMAYEALMRSKDFIGVNHSQNTIVSNADYSRQMKASWDAGKRFIFLFPQGNVPTGMIEETSRLNPTVAEYTFRHLQRMGKKVAAIPVDMAALEHGLSAPENRYDRSKNPVYEVRVGDAIMPQEVVTLMNLRKSRAEATGVRSPLMSIVQLHYAEGSAKTYQQYESGIVPIENMIEFMDEISLQNFGQCHQLSGKARDSMFK